MSKGSECCSSGLSLEGRVAAVTGGGRGIGREISLALAREGADICIIDVLADEAEKCAEEIRKVGRNAKSYAVDITDSTAVTDMFKKASAELGKVDILVNNAGITKDNLLLRMSDDEWDKVLAVNLKGAFVCTRAALRYMLKSKAGRIVNIASVVGVTGNAGQGNYSASKAGLIGLTKSTAREVASRGITVNAVAPGFIGTAMTDGMTDEARKRAMEMVPLGRIGDPKEVAEAVLFLASDRAAYITGHVLKVDGGFAM